MKALRKLLIITVLVAAASCAGEGRDYFAGSVSLDSDAASGPDGMYEPSFCEGLYNLGAILSDPAPEQDVTGNAIRLDDANERFLLIAYGSGTAMILEIAGEAGFVEVGPPVVDDANLGMSGTAAITSGDFTGTLTNGIPVLTNTATYMTPATITAALTFTDTGIPLARPAPNELFQTSGTITLGGVDCTAADDTANVGLDYTLTLTNVLAHEAEVDGVLLP